MRHGWFEACNLSLRATAGSELLGYLWRVLKNTEVITTFDKNWVCKLSLSTITTDSAAQNFWVTYGACSKTFNESDNFIFLTSERNTVLSGGWQNRICTCGIICGKASLTVDITPHHLTKGTVLYQIGCFLHIVLWICIIQMSKYVAKSILLQSHR